MLGVLFPLVAFSEGIGHFAPHVLELDLITILDEQLDMTEPKVLFFVAEGQCQVARAAGESDLHGNTQATRGDRVVVLFALLDYPIEVASYNS